MDSITKLQSKLAEAENILKYVSKELNGYAQDKSVGSNLNFAEIKLRGEQYSFYEHPLKNQMFQDEYFALMIYVISLGGKKEEGWTILYRIAAGCDYQKDLQYLTTDAMTFTEERLSEIIRLIYSADMSRTFAIDSLMICFHMGADDAQLKFLANLYDLLKLDKNFLAEAIQFVKIFDSTFWDNLAEKIAVWKSLTVKNILTYIAYTANSLDEAAQLNDKHVVVSGITYTDKDVLNLDTWQPNTILFVDCHFEYCGGIAANDKFVKFVNCTFNGNVKRWEYYYEYYSSHYFWTDNQYSAYRGFLHLNNAEFLACSFKNFFDNIPMMYLNKGFIHSCNLENCGCGSHSRSMLLYINNTQVKENKIISCKIEVGYSAPKGSSQICMIYSANSKWEHNTFFSCNSTFHYDQKASFNCLILLDKNSICTDCSFGRIGVYANFSPPVPAYIIGLRDSKESNNTIGEITTKDTKPVGEIYNISKDMFIVGDKHYDN